MMDATEKMLLEAARNGDVRSACALLPWLLENTTTIEQEQVIAWLLDGDKSWVDVRRLIVSVVERCLEEGT